MLTYSSLTAGIASGEGAWERDGIPSALLKGSAKSSASDLISFIFFFFLSSFSLTFFLRTAKSYKARKKRQHKSQNCIFYNRSEGLICMLFSEHPPVEERKILIRHLALFSFCCFFSSFFFFPTKPSERSYRLILTPIKEPKICCIDFIFIFHL